MWKTSIRDSTAERRQARVPYSIETMIGQKTVSGRYGSSKLSANNNNDNDISSFL